MQIDKPATRITRSGLANWCFGMNFPILILIGVLAAYAAVRPGVAQSSAASPQSQSQQEPGQAASPSQQPTPPSTQSGQPCAESKETCELPPEATAPHQAEPSSGTQAPSKPTAAKPKSAKHKRRHKKPPAQSNSATGSKKIIVRNGGTSELNSALSPGITAGQANYSLQNTNQLLSTTDANLKAASSRPLNANQQSTVDQIRVFMEQANEAVKAGDLDRAHNLAVKAHLLSADLVKQ